VFDSENSASGTVSVSFTLQNGADVQVAREPIVQSCTGASIKISERASPPILGASAFRIVGPQPVGQVRRIRKKMSNALASEILSMVNRRDIPSAVSLRVLTMEAARFPEILSSRLPVASRLAGVSDMAGLNLTVDMASAGFSLNSSLDVFFPVLTGLTRMAGGCFTPPDNTIDICLPGYVGIFAWNGSSRRWRSITDLDDSTIGVASISVGLPGAGVYSPVASPPCINVKGKGRAGGDKVCLSSPMPGRSLFGELAN
jgi:hypothetical protein